MSPPESELRTSVRRGVVRYDFSQHCFLVTPTNHTKPFALPDDQMRVAARLWREGLLDVSESGRVSFT